jgi:hypothetical protein
MSQKRILLLGEIHRPQPTRPDLRCLPPCESNSAWNSNQPGVPAEVLAVDHVERSGEN